MSTDVRVQVLLLIAESVSATEFTMFDLSRVPRSERAAFLAVIPGRPVPKARARVTAHGAYTPERTRDAEALMRGTLLERCRQPLEGPLQVTLSFSFASPQRWSKQQKAALPWHSGRPDLDNLVKLVLDAAKGVLWHDDGQVVKLGARKFYASKAQTCIEVKEAA